MDIFYFVGVEGQNGHSRNERLIPTTPLEINLSFPILKLVGLMISISISIPIPNSILRNKCYQ